MTESLKEQRRDPVSWSIDFSRSLVLKIRFFFPVQPRIPSLFSSSLLLNGVFVVFWSDSIFPFLDYPLPVRQSKSVACQARQSTLLLGSKRFRSFPPDHVANLFIKTWQAIQTTRFFSFWISSPSRSVFCERWVGVHPHFLFCLFFTLHARSLGQTPLAQSSIYSLSLSLSEKGSVKEIFDPDYKTNGVVISTDCQNRFNFYNNNVCRSDTERTRWEAK